MEPKQHRSPVNHPRTNFLRGSANGCSSDSTFSCRRSHIHVQCVGARTKKGAVCRNNTDVASIIVRCPGILQGFPGSSGKSPRLDWNIRDQFCKIGEAHSEVHVGSNLIPKQRYKRCGRPPGHRDNRLKLSCERQILPLEFRPSSQGDPLKSAAASMHARQQDLAYNDVVTRMQNCEHTEQH